MIQGFITPLKEKIKLSHDQLLPYSIAETTKLLGCNSKRKIMNHSIYAPVRNGCYYDFLLIHGYHNMNPLGETGITQIKEDKIYLTEEDENINSTSLPTFLTTSHLVFQNKDANEYQNCGFIAPNGNIISWDYKTTSIIHDWVAFTILNAYFLEQEKAYQNYLKSELSYTNYFIHYYQFVRYYFIQNQLHIIDNIRSLEQEKTGYKIEKMLKKE